ncbi:MAG: serine--tRNA ligase [Ignavibacteria bacterium]|nr:serine--tRNA ligase [Ignavibacteria bacterium]
MLDIKLIRENPDFVIKKLKLRNESIDNVDKIRELDERKREILVKVENLKKIRNETSAEIGKLKSRGIDVSDKMEEMKKIADEIKLLDEEVKKFETEIQNLLYYIPALPSDDCPVGKGPEDNVVIKVYGTEKQFDFEIKDHIELGELHDIIDFERGAKITGRGFPLYKGKGAILERALINFMLDTHIANGYQEVITPVLVNRKSMEAAEKVPKFEYDMYRIEEDDLFAIPTAEVPIINIHRDEIFSIEELPKKYCGFTNCFRREAGSYGKETKGFLRVHQFNKVELINFCLPENSYSEMEKMLQDACGILDKLNMYYRVVELCTADLGFAASRCYDLEVWSYAEKKWLEVSSISNCTDFQARRGMIRFKRTTEKGKQKTEFVHILNGSGLATSRLIVGLLEANQQADGKIRIPDVLVKYTGFDII